MRRKQILKTIVTGVSAMSSLSAFNNFTSGLKETESLMPVFLIGHGSPMNGMKTTNSAIDGNKWQKNSNSDSSRK